MEELRTELNAEIKHFGFTLNSNEELSSDGT
jgi:hypothetical protein